MRVLFVEGQDRGALLALGQALAHPFWLLEGEGVWLLQVFGVGKEAEDRARALGEVRVWAFTLEHGVSYGGCGKR